MRQRRRIGIGSALVAAVAIIGTAMSSGQLPTMSELAGGSTTASSPADSSIVELLPHVRVVPAVHRQPGYERDCGTDKKTGTPQGCVFGRSWNNPENRTGCDTRNLVLADQLADVKFKPGTRNCKVTSGWRVDPYTGQRITLGQIDLDHIVPLSAAWNAGAWNWPLQRRVAFANDPDNLLAVLSRANSSKSDSTISEWLPAVGQCDYIARYLSVAIKYELPISEADRRTASTTCPALPT